MVGEARETSPPALSVVVPVFNGGAAVGARLVQLADQLAARDIAVELILVDDGSTDDTPSRLAAVAASARISARVVSHERNQGKDAAIVSGMRASRGRFRVFVDADSAYPPSEIFRIHDALGGGADVAIACRLHPDSRLFIRPTYLLYFMLRHGLGRLLNGLVRLGLLPGLLDTQAGLKGMARC